MTTQKINTNNVIAAVAVIGRNNNPLYLKTHGSDGSQKQFFHFVVHASLDVIEEKVKRRAKTDKAEKYLGLLYPTEDYKIYGYHTNTQVKMILVVTESAAIKDVDVKLFLKNFILFMFQLQQIHFMKQIRRYPLLILRRR